MIDSHIQLSYKSCDPVLPYIAVDGEDYSIDYADRKALIDSMKDAGIDCCIEPDIDAEANRFLLNLSREYPQFVYPAVGNHPTRYIRSNIRDFRKVREFAADDKVIAIGETWLDYHYERKE